MIKVHFLGANRQVTGSRYCLETDHARILIDCGMFQERPFQDRNWEPFSIDPKSIDAVVLTHVHVDHSGLLPKLVRDGFSGPVYSTRPTVDLARVVLNDSAKIQTEDVKFKLKRHKKEGRRGKHPAVPLYTDQDVEKTLPLFQGVPYGSSMMLADSMEMTFHDAGHILGSAMLEFEIQEQGHSVRVLFSGDIGQWGKPLIRDPTLFDSADYVIMETTYGDRDHPPASDIEAQLESTIRETVERGGNVVIPIFAVERAQEVTYCLSRLAHDHRIPKLPVFLDSPMAVDVTDIFRRFPDCLDNETWQMIQADERPLQFPGLKMVRSVEQSKQINDVREPCVIMATSGMCTAGRIKHHLRSNIERPESTILFVGYQAQGTLGRQIVDGSPFVRIHGRDRSIKARVERIDGFSGHADRSTLLKWVGHLKTEPRGIYLTHGDESSSRSFAELLDRELGWNATVPEFGQTVNLTFSGSE